MRVMHPDLLDMRGGIGNKILFPQITLQYIWVWLWKCYHLSYKLNVYLYICKRRR